MKKQHYWLVGILAVAALLRLYKLTAISLWHDEAFSALLINYPWREMIYRIGLDVHPPGYYILLRVWADIFGHSLFALRGFSAFFSVAAVYAVYLVTRESFGDKVMALSAAAIVALNPFQIQYVTEARMYTFGTFAILMSVYYMIKAFKAQKEYFESRAQKKTATAEPHRIINRLWLNWLLFAVFTSLCLYTHYYLFFSTLAVGLFGLYYLVKTYGLRARAYLYFVAAYVLVFISYVPWIKTFLFQFRQVQDNYWIPKINKWSIPLTVWEMLTGASADAAKRSTDVLITLGVIFSVWMIIKVLRREHSIHKWQIILGLVIPFIGASLLSLKQSIFLDRYFLFAGLFYSIALAVFIFKFYNRALRYFLLGVVLFVSAYNWTLNWKHLNVDSKPGMAAATNFMNNNVASKDVVVIGTSFEFFNYKYYNKTGIAPLLYTPGINQVSDLPHFSGTALLTNDDLIHNFNAIAPGTKVWVLWTTGFGGSETLVPSTWQTLEKRSWEDVRPYSGTWIVVDQYVAG